MQNFIHIYCSTGSNMNWVQRARDRIHNDYCFVVEGSAVLLIPNQPLFALSIF